MSNEANGNGNGTDPRAVRRARPPVWSLPPGHRRTLKPKVFADHLLRHSSWFVIGLQGVLVVLSLLSAWLLLLNFSLPGPKLVFSAAALLVVLRLLAIRCFHLHHGWWRYTGIPDAINVSKAIVTSSLVFWLLAMVLEPLRGIPRSIFLLEPVIAILFLAGARVTSRALVESMSVDRKASRRCVVIGAGAASESILREMRRPNTGYSPVACVDDDPSKQGLTIHGVEVMGTVEDLPQLLEMHDVDEVLIAVPSATEHQMARFIGFCSQAGIPFRTLPSVSKILSGKVSLTEFREVRLEDLLGRRPVHIELEAVRRQIEGRRILITGAAGSIGSELCRQITAFDPACLVCVDQWETGLFYLQADLERRRIHSDLVMRVADITDAARMQAILEVFQPEVVFHAAAYKHVPLMEANAEEAIRNNVFGLTTLLDLAEAAGSEKFILVSSDKAVNPSSIMGVTKRIGELVLASRPPTRMQCASVRFGNVLGTAGSVVPVLQEQLRNNQPLTLTHPDAKRFFMTVGEAVALIIQAFAMAGHGDILVLDMGEQVPILELARNLIKLSGRPQEGVAIAYTGLRPGEKIAEELFYPSEEILATTHSRIRRAHGTIVPWRVLQAKLHRLQVCLAGADMDGLRCAAQDLVPEYEWREPASALKYFEKSAASEV